MVDNLQETVSKNVQKNTPDEVASFFWSSDSRKEKISEAIKSFWSTKLTFNEDSIAWKTIDVFFKSNNKLTKNVLLIDGEHNDHEIIWELVEYGNDTLLKFRLSDSDQDLSDLTFVWFENKQYVWTFELNDDGSVKHKINDTNSDDRNNEELRNELYIENQWKDSLQLDFWSKSEVKLYFNKLPSDSISLILDDGNVIKPKDISENEEVSIYEIEHNLSNLTIYWVNPKQYLRSTSIDKFPLNPIKKIIKVIAKSN